MVIMVAWLLSLKDTQDAWITTSYKHTTAEE